MTNYDINGKWVLWFHSLSENKWTKTSYKEIYSINDLMDYKTLITQLNLQHLQNGMYFLMRENIFPNWEDPDNREGGCWSYKVTCKNIKSVWEQLMERCITENVLDPSDDKTDQENIEFNMDEINGISISPKKEFNIIKLWNKNSGEVMNFKLEGTHKLLEDESYIYKKHLVED